MPIGKNSLNRVKNNGYSAVKTEAPDMENSTVVTPAVEENTAPVSNNAENAEVQPEKKTAPANKKTSPKPKASGKTSAAQTQAPETVKKPRKPKAEAKKQKGAPTPEEKGYYNFGDELPIYLL